MLLEESALAQDQLYAQQDDFSGTTSHRVEDLKRTINRLKMNEKVLKEKVLSLQKDLDIERLSSNNKTGTRKKSRNLRPGSPYKRIGSNLSSKKSGKKPYRLNRTPSKNKNRSKSKKRTSSRKSLGSERGSIISNSSKLSRKSNTSIRSKKKALYTGIRNEYKPRRNVGVAGLVKRRSKSRDKGLKNRSKSRDSERNRSFSKGK